MAKKSLELVQCVEYKYATNPIAVLEKQLLNKGVQLYEVKSNINSILAYFNCRNYGNYNRSYHNYYRCKTYHKNSLNNHEKAILHIKITGINVTKKLQDEINKIDICLKKETNNLDSLLQKFWKTGGGLKLLSEIYACETQKDFEKMISSYTNEKENDYYNNPLIGYYNNLQVAKTNIILSIVVNNDPSSENHIMFYGSNNVEFRLFDTHELPEIYYTCYKYGSYAEDYCNKAFYEAFCRRFFNQWLDENFTNEYQNFYYTIPDENYQFIYPLDKKINSLKLPDCVSGNLSYNDNVTDGYDPNSYDDISEMSPMSQLMLPVTGVSNDNSSVDEYTTPNNSIDYNLM